MDTPAAHTHTLDRHSISGQYIFFNSITAIVAGQRREIYGIFTRWYIRFVIFRFSIYQEFVPLSFSMRQKKIHFRKCTAHQVILLGIVYVTR